MNWDHFCRQMDRLVEEFGKYSKPKIELIWNEVRSYSDSFFTKAVNDWVGCADRKPNLIQVREKVSLERERIHQEEKKKYKDDMQSLISQQLPDGEVSLIIDEIQRKIRGNMSDKEFSDFNSVLKYTGRKSQCARCDDTGVYWQEGGLVECLH